MAARFSHHVAVAIGVFKKRESRRGRMIPEPEEIEEVEVEEEPEEEPEETVPSL